MQGNLPLGQEQHFFCVVAAVTMRSIVSLHDALTISELRSAPGVESHSARESPTETGSTTTSAATPYSRPRSPDYRQRRKDSRESDTTELQSPVETICSDLID